MFLTHYDLPVRCCFFIYVHTNLHKEPKPYFQKLKNPYFGLKIKPPVTGTRFFKFE